jgi:anti-anti-sigma factor
MNMNIATTARSASVRVVGDLDYATTGDFVDAVCELLAQQPTFVNLHLDFSELSYCDSAGLSGLLLIHGRASGAGIRLHLDHRPPFLDRILDITGMLEYLTTPPRQDARSPARHSVSEESEVR